MAASCFAIPLSSSRSSNNAIPRFKTLTSLTASYSYLEPLKAQFLSSTSFHLSSLPHSFLAQIKVSSSELSVLDEEQVKGEGDGETGEEPAVAKKSGPCELYVCNIPRSYDIAQLLDMFQPIGTVISVEVLVKNL